MKRREKIREDNAERQDKVEKARQSIFKKGYSIVSTAFQNLMGLTSLVPTRASHFVVILSCFYFFNDYSQNAFSTRLSKFGFNFHSMLAPDLLHEFELGVWKAVFTHLVRMVYTLGASAIQTLDQR